MKEKRAAVAPPKNQNVETKKQIKIERIKARYSYIAK